MTKLVRWYKVIPKDDELTQIHKRDVVATNRTFCWMVIPERAFEVTEDDHNVRPDMWSLCKRCFKEAK